mmetsp:Transcript_12958/g.15827  ORF Transcript_12958/g.15827 Transcript_12958/m.15827 type:complete len:477 (+) Transcript_12958:178-1608(+)
MNYFHFQKKYQTRTACICGLDKCKDVVKAFRKIEDVRGNVQRIPNSIASSRKSSIQSVNEFYIKRLLAHRRDGNKNGLSKQRNERPPKKTTRSTASCTKKEDVFVALWHFDKVLLQQYLSSGNDTSLPKMIDKKMAIAHGILGADGCYSNADIHKQWNDKKKIPILESEHVVLVPTFYSVTEAFNDITKANVSFEDFQLVRNAETKLQARPSIRSSTISLCSSQDCNGQSNSLISNLSNSKKRKGPTLNMDSVRSIQSLPKRQCTEYLNALHSSIDEYKKWASTEINRLNEKADQLDLYERLLGEAQVKIKQIELERDAACKELKESNDCKFDEDDILEKLKRMGGLNRISLVSKNGVCTDPNISRQLYGFRDFEFCIDFLETVFEIKYEEPIQSTISAGYNKGLTDIEQCLLTLVYTNTRWGYDILGLMFGVASVSTVGDYIIKWMPLLGERGDMMSSLLMFMDEDSYEALEPKS